MNEIMELIRQQELKENVEEYSISFSSSKYYNFIFFKGKNKNFSIKRKTKLKLNHCKNQKQNNHPRFKKKHLN
jgi:hypothetical protein